MKKEMEKKKQFKQSENPKLPLAVNPVEKNTVVRSCKQRYQDGSVGNATCDQD